MGQVETDARQRAIDQLTVAFSDTIAGYVTTWNPDTTTFGIRTSDGREFSVKVNYGKTYAYFARNLGDPYQDATMRMGSLLVPGRMLFVYGVFYPENGDVTFEAQFLVFVGRTADEFSFERSNWWVQQIRELGEFYLRAQFGDDPIDYVNYRTTISLDGKRPNYNFRQETDTISRLVYGFASAYLFTGDDRFIEAAEKGSDYLRDHMRFYDADENIVYWYHGIDVSGTRETKVFASEFGDDIDAIPAYEQIYALAGPTQTYRVTGDPRILRDAELTVDLFDRFFLDRNLGGYFSHLDPITLDPVSDALGPNKGKKNWNSIGDHAPAYLINLYLATGSDRYARMLEYTFDTICKYFPNYEESPFVQEKFFEDWSHDRTHLWQQNRGVVGHNLKIAWNLMRMYGLKDKPEYESFARKIAEIMPAVGFDQQRFGWYDVMERMLSGNEQKYRFAFHDRKAWWQQEQGILAYLILHGILKDEDYLKYSRESSAFYNSFFLDHDDGAVYFNVLANGIPYLMGTERYKGSHSMSGYHSFELCYLAQTYTNLLITGQPLNLYFRPRPDGFSRDRILRVQPDILPRGSVRLTDVTIDGEPYTNFDADKLTVKLPDSKSDLRVVATVTPVAR